MPSGLHTDAGYHVTVPHDPSQPQPTRRSRREIREGAAADFQPTEPLTRGAADPAPGSADPLNIFTPEPPPEPAPDRSPAAPKRKRRIWPWIVAPLVALILLGGAAAVAGAAFYGEATEARTHLLEAKGKLTALGQQLDAGDQAGMQTTADALTADVTAAAEIVDGPLWEVAARVPFVGQNVDAVQRVTRAVDVLVEDALPVGMQIATTVDLKHLTVEGGGINLEPFRQVQSSIPVLADAFAAAQAQIAPIDKSNLVPYVAEPIDEILTIIDDSAPALDVVNRYLPTLLDMAGSGGTKTYLVIFQNNAEIRATGGNPAASMVMTLTDGKLGMADQANVATFEQAGAAGQRYTPLLPETTDLYLPTFSEYSQDYTMTPDFPTTAQLFQDLWAHTNGSQFDGVISIDPVVLSHMLAVAGPLPLATGEQITADNAVQLLLSDAYVRYPNGADSDLFFADVAARVFAHITSASWDPMAMLDALKLSADEQRIYLSFTNPEAQALAVELGVDGGLAPDTTTQTQLGMYLNDSSVGKLEYHLTTSVAASCDPNARTITTTMSMTNSIPDGITTPYILGLRNPTYGLDRTAMMLDVVFFAPPGAQILQTDPAESRVGEWERTGVEKGNTAVSKTVFVPQGETVTASYTVALPPGELGPLNLRHTPTANATAVTIDPSCDALFAP